MGKPKLVIDSFPQYDAAGYAYINEELVVGYNASILGDYELRVRTTLWNKIVWRFDSVEFQIDDNCRWPVVEQLNEWLRLGRIKGVLMENKNRTKMGGY
jgi:hypothetical protein